MHDDAGRRDACRYGAGAANVRVKDGKQRGSFTEHD